jgi:hypothetical protein
MEMSQEIRCFATRQAEAPAPSAETTIYTHPDEVIRDSKPTLAEKKAILATWASDARAVENAPSLRQLDSGAVVEVEAILQALVADNLLRQTVYVGLREDKPADQVRREAAQ